jgi:hypothetical protein
MVHARYWFMAAVIGASGLAAGCEEDVWHSDDDSRVTATGLVVRQHAFESNYEGGRIEISEMTVHFCDLDGCFLKTMLFEPSDDAASADGTLCLKEDASLCAHVTCTVADFCGDDFRGCMTCEFHQDFLVADGHFLGGTLLEAQKIRAQQIDGETDIDSDFFIFFFPG